MANQIISGAVILSPSTLPLLGVRVEFWDSINGWIGSTITTLEGQFLLSVDEKYFDIPSPPGPGFQYVFKVFKDNIQIGSISYDDVFVFDEVEINISEPLYDTLVADKLEDASQKKFINISGKVTTGSGVPFFPGTAVRLVDLTSKKGTEVLRVPIGVGGQYSIRLNSKVFDSATTLYKHAFRLEVVAIDDFGSSVVKYATTNIYYNWEDYNEIDIVVHTEAPIAKDEFEQLNHALELTKTPIELFYSPEDISTNDIITLLVARTGITPDIWEIFVNAVRHAQDIIAFLEIDPEDPNIDSITWLIQLTMYGLLRPSGGHDNPLDKIDVNQLQDTITASIDAYYIQEEWNEQAVLTFATNLYKTYRTKKIITSNVSGEEFTAENVFDVIFDDTNTRDSYISLVLDGYDTVEDFWTSFETIHGSLITVNTQNRLILNSITGSQPEIIDALKTTDVHDLSKLTYGDWVDLITDVSDDAGRICVPAQIKAETESDVKAIEQYASTLKELIQNTYPLTNIANKLDEEIIPDEEIREEVILFIEQNPQFDIRKVKADDIDNGDYDLEGITDIAGVKEALLPFQRLLKVTDGEPELVMALLKDGIGSATEIVNIPFEEFSVAYSPYLKNLALTQVIYGRAITINSISSWTLVTQYRAFTDQVLYVMPINRYNAVAEPNLETLFHIGSYCKCSECMSLYSPVAYYTDILNFLKKFVPSAYTELVRRRPDLIHIDLTCKNANTALPYIDLVNELLENTILEHVPSPPTIIKSYQTQGVTNELNAYPEHVIKNSSGVYEDITAHHYVYDTVLTTAVYPHNLPFSLPIEETRVYLQHMGISRYESMKFFRSAVNTTPLDVNYVTATAINSEFLGLTIPSLAIITNTNLSNPWIYFGLAASNTTIIDPFDSSLTITGNWYDLLTDRLDVLLHYGQFSYQELLQILTCAFLNPYNNSIDRRPVAIVSTDPEHPDTCELNKLKLDFIIGVTKEAFLKRLVRFVRLIKTNKLKIHQWDILFRSLDISNIDVYEYNTAMRAVQLSEQLNIAPELLSFWWHQADTEKYADYNNEPISVRHSVYDRVFRSRAMVASGLFPDGGPAVAQPYNSGDNAASIASVCKVKEEELFLILRALGIDPSDDITLLIISKIYILGLVAKSQNCSIKDLLAYSWLLGFQINNAPLGILAQSNSTLVDFLNSFLNLYKIVSNSPFTLAEYDYLLRNNDERLVFVPKISTIAAFYTTLRTELQLYAAYIAPVSPGSEELEEAQDRLKEVLNVIFQQYVKEFDMPLEWAELFVTEYDMSTAEVGGDIEFILETLRNSTIAIEAADFNGFISIDDDFEQLFTLYRRIHKYVFIAKKLKMTKEEFVYAYTTPTAVGFDFIDIPTPASTTGPIAVDSTQVLFLGFVRIGLCIDIRDKYQFDDGDLVNFIKSLYTPDKNVWMEILVRNTEWPNIVELVDDGSGNPGILGDDWPAGFFPTIHTNLQRILSMLDIMYWCRRTGLNPAAFQSVLKGNPVLSNSYKVMQAARAKHGDMEWFTVGKPIRDAVRIKQRDALLGFVLYYPVLVNARKWQKINDVYAYLLIDVEMEACMQTSRIKQGISSVQLFVDRILLGLEYVYSTTTRINMLPVYIEQWESWRKWYRVWEANRKIFLYPENWIEPELRDDKSPFFEELEQDLSKGDINEDLASDAFLTYLHKLDGIARLEPSGHYYDSQTQITHVIARTIGSPHTYYYRQLKEEEWTAWEEVNANIEGEHLAPVFWKGKLFLFWLTFVDRKGKVKSNIEPVDNGGKVWTNQVAYNPTTSYAHDSTESGLVEHSILDVSLNWAEYKDGKWLKQKLTNEPAIIKFYPDMEGYYYGILGGGGFSYITDRYRFLTNNGSLQIMDLVKMKLFVHNSIDSDGNLYIKLTYPTTARFSNEEEFSFYLHGFKFATDSMEPVVWKNPRSNTNLINIYTWVRPSPYGTLFYNSKLIKELPFTGRDASKNKLFVDDYNGFGTWPLPAYYANSFVLNGGNARNTPMTKAILNKLPHGIHILTTDSGFGVNPLEKQFFFNDDKNTYFVRKIQERIVISPPVWLGGNTYTAGVMQIINKYNFFTFYHSHVTNFIKALTANGIKGLMDIRNQVKADTMGFVTDYSPNQDLVRDRYPSNRVDFEFGGAYAVYNWELFFHAPLMIAQRLSTNKKFDEARKWYHYIFDPTSNLNDQGSTSTNKQRFWRFRPFYEEAGRPVQTLNDLLDLINQNNANAVAQVRRWENNPFQPHTIARMRILAYMKNVVMKYLDNLIAWGDQLFERDTIESINEATQLYILAANILGERPQEIPQRAYTAPKSFYELAGSLDAFSNAMVQIENYIDPSLPPTYTYTNHKETATTTDMGKMYYFCLPANPKLLAYWDTVADRLFKIRNCMSIDGQVRQLPLFEPPIDPALLVRAAAAGMSTNDLLASIYSTPGYYRFPTILQKANEICSDVKVLGNAILAALEKRDAEELALLRSTHEIQLLEKIKELKEIQVREAQANIDAIEKSKDVYRFKQEWYLGKKWMNGFEEASLIMYDTVRNQQMWAGIFMGISQVTAAIPQLHAQLMASGASYGGMQISSIIQAVSTVFTIFAQMNQITAMKLATIGGYFERYLEYLQQGVSARLELGHIDKQVIAAQIRKSIAEKDVQNQKLQIEQAQAVDAYMRSKFTNQQLYEWMINQISTSYFQSYQLALDTAKKAEACFKYELPKAVKPDGYIKSGYWDSLKKGLLAGEKLQYDLRRLELAYLNGNKRELELTKHISLALTDPFALLELRRTGECSFFTPELIYDLDFPGHYNRRIRSLSISIPCVAGPYTTINATLTQGENEIRYEPIMDNSYLRHGQSVSNMLATSSAQNDSGMFELNFKDDRYLPFEYAGVISYWQLRLADATLNQLRLFDFETISDVILHVKYTAIDSGNIEFKEDVIELINEKLDEIGSVSLVQRLSSLNQEFSNAWNLYNSTFGEDNNAMVDISLNSNFFPYFVSKKELDVAYVHVYLKAKHNVILSNYKVMIKDAGNNEWGTTINLSAIGGMFSGICTDITGMVINIEQTQILRFQFFDDNISEAPVNITELVDECYFVVEYKAS